MKNGKLLILISLVLFISLFHLKAMAAPRYIYTTPFTIENNFDSSQAEANFSPLDDPDERYEFDFKKGKYEINLGYSNEKNTESYTDQLYEEFEPTIYEPVNNYNLSLEYNIIKGLKLRLNRNWVPEYSITQYANPDSTDKRTNTNSMSNWAFECIYKTEPTAHELYFSYQSGESNLSGNEEYEFSSDELHYNNKQISDSITIAYTPDISVGGLGVTFNYDNYENNREELDLSTTNSNQIQMENSYGIQISYQGQI